jgi:tetratricopeptide (TPR) repeat protein
MKRLLLIGALLIALCYPAMSQAYDPNTPDGGMIASIQKESDASKKQAMLEEFVQKYPDSRNVGWAWGQLQAAYLQAQQYDKAIDAGQKSLVGDPDQAEVAYNNLKAAEAKNDPDAVMKWSAETSRAARKEITSPKPGDGKEQIDYAKQVDTYAEYSIFATALKTTDPAKVVALVESLEQRNPDSPYVSKAYGRYLNALRQAGQNDKAGAAAEKEAQRDASNEDVLLVAADYNTHGKDQDKSLTYSTKLAELMQSKPKPEEVSDADWQKKKATLLGLAYWMQGASYNGKKQFSQADKALRQALPLVKGDNQLEPVVLFQLGIADFQLGKTSKSKAMMQDALKFSKQSAAMKSPVQTDAQNNVKAISSSLGPRR